MIKFDLTAFIYSLLPSVIAFYVGGIGVAMLTTFSYIAFFVGGIGVAMLTMAFSYCFIIWYDVNKTKAEWKEKLGLLDILLKEENAREIFDEILKNEFEFDQKIIEAFDLDNSDMNFLISRYKNINFKSGKIGKDYSALEIFTYYAFLNQDLNFFMSVARSDGDVIRFINQILLCLGMRSILVAECLNPAFDKYSKVLVRKYKQLDIKDDYGDSQPDLWIKELEWFYKNKIEREIKELQTKNLPKLNFLFADKQVYFLYENGSYKDEDGKMIDFVTWYLWRLVIQEEDREENELGYYENMDGLEYEQFIKNCFIKNGCEAQVTKASGDQGVDVVAEIGDKRIAVQCKHYNSKVGNDAIQQVYSAKDFFDCNIAVVISNNNFTNQAKQLASKLGVYLLHHENIEEFVSEIIN